MPQSIAISIEKNYYEQSSAYDITRMFDVIIGLIGLMIFSPLLLLIALTIKISSKGPVIFAQKRVGKNNTDFTLYKFRTMCVHNDESRSLTVGKNDNRITRVGSFLRRYKLDELPQLYNVLKNEMSIVGPRPEVRRYVDFYTSEQCEILFLKPGITDYASILFRNENELLAVQPDFEQYYIERIMPVKIRLNARYKNDRSLKNYFIIIFKTICSIFK